MPHETHERCRRCMANFPGSEYSDDEREFLAAMAGYVKAHRFPSFTEVLAVAESLGWRRDRTLPLAPDCVSPPDEKTTPA